MTAPLNPYHARMLRVLDHIDRHLDGELDLATVSAVAAFSRFHFHRQFKATFGVSLHRYVQLARLRRAAGQLADGPRPSVTEIALDAARPPTGRRRASDARAGHSGAGIRRRSP